MQQNLDNNLLRAQPTDYVADISVYRAIEGIKLDCRRIQRERMVPSLLPKSRSEAGKTCITSLITKEHVPAL